MLGDTAESMGAVSNPSPKQSSQGGDISGKAVAVPPSQAVVLAPSDGTKL